MRVVGFDQIVVVLRRRAHREIPGQCAEQHAAADRDPHHREGMVAKVRAPVGERPRLVFEELEIATQLVALGHDVPFYLACAFAH